MTKYFFSSQLTDKTPVKCLLYSNHCKSAHLVDIAPLGELRRARTHKDLDIFMWCPDMPHYTTDFVDLDSHRIFVAHEEGRAGPDKGEGYVIMHYDQVSLGAVRSYLDSIDGEREKEREFTLTEIF